MKTQGAYHGDQRVKTPVVGMGSESGNETLLFDPPAREIFIVNDSETDSLSFTVTDENGETYDFTLLHCESLDERFVPFVSVAVTAVGAWRWIAKSGRVT